MYHLIKDDQIIDSKEELKGAFTLEDGRSLSNIEALNDEELKTIGWLKEIKNEPEFDQLEGKLSGPVIDITADNVFKTYSFEPFTEEEKAEKVKSKIDMLWRSASDYEHNAISGSAIGLLSLGVLQGKPKATVVQAWLKTIWDLYYQRKALTTYKSEPDIDFSSCGEIPHTVPELIEELYG